MDKVNDKIIGIKSLKRGNGLVYLLNEGFRLIGNPILAHDMSYILIGYTEGIVTDDPIWNSYVLSGFASCELQEFFKNECFLDTAANAKKITFLYSDKLKYDRIYGKLFNSEKTQIGCACMMASHTPFTENTPYLFELLCDVLNEEISHIEHYTEYGRVYQESLMNKLIEGKVSDKALYSAHVESIYIGLKERLYLAVCDIDESGDSDNDSAYYRNLFKQRLPNCKCTVYNKYVVVILSSDNSDLDAAQLFYELTSVIAERNVCIGISGDFDNLFELNKYYLEAVTALTEGKKENTAKHIFTYKRQGH